MKKLIYTIIAFLSNGYENIATNLKLLLKIWHENILWSIWIIEDIPDDIKISINRRKRHQRSKVIKQYLKKREDALLNNQRKS